MDEIDTPYKRAVNMIIRSIINCEDRYVLDKRYVRWGKVEHDLWELEQRHLTSRQSRAAECYVLCGWYKERKGCIL